MTAALLERAALAVLGLWLGLLAASWAVASVNFRTVERLLSPAAAPAFETRLAPLAAADRRIVLRHVMAEVNRWIFRTSAPLHAVLGLVLLALVWRSGGWVRGLAVLLLVASAVQALAIGPTMARIGASLDFFDRATMPEESRRFGMLHGAYVLIDLAKILGLGAAVALLVRRG